MLCLSGWLANYWNWWMDRTKSRPAIWMASIVAVLLIAIMLAEKIGVGVWVILVLMVLLVPGFFAANKHLSRKLDRKMNEQEVKREQMAKAARIKKLISLGQKETNR